MAGVADVLADPLGRLRRQAHALAVEPVLAAFARDVEEGGAVGLAADAVEVPRLVADGVS